MAKDNQNITFKGDKISVIGRSVAVGDSLPSFKVTGTDMADLTPESFNGKILVIASIPSVDTPVCDIEIKRFNQDVSSLSEDVSVLTVSLDLPFAQKRWCAAEGVEQVVCGSDYKHRAFGEDFGTYIQELGLLTRAVFVADKTGKVIHVEYVDDVTAEPNYDAVIEKIKEAL